VWGEGGMVSGYAGVYVEAGGLRAYLGVCACRACVGVSLLTWTNSPILFGPRATSANTNDFSPAFGALFYPAKLFVS